MGDPLTERFVIPGQAMTYTVTFENQTTATAAAQEVTVTDQLDPNLDWNTFKLGEIAFNNQTVTSLAGKNNGADQVAQAGSTLQVNLQAGINPATGLVTWRLRSVDPETGDWPADPYAGLLYPDDATHRGEGHVTFTVNSKADTPVGTKITNQSRIVFDTNDPIDTNQVFNTISTAAPAVPASPLPGDGSTTMTVEGFLLWSPSDYAANYKIYLWKNGESEPATPMATNLSNAGFDPGGLSYNTAYCWQVVACNAFGQTPGPEWIFHTGNSSPTPGKNAVKPQEWMLYE